jgi:hypothetical protein
MIMRQFVILTAFFHFSQRLCPALLDHPRPARRRRPLGRTLVQHRSARVARNARCSRRRRRSDEARLKGDGISRCGQ